MERIIYDNRIPRALREMSKFMGQHTGELSHGEPSDQRHSDRQHQIIANHTQQATSKARTRVDITVNVDTTRSR